MGVLDFFSKWNEKRKKKREDEAVDQIDSLLEGEGRAIVGLRALLARIKAEPDKQKRALIYVQFERNLHKFEEWSGIIESIDKKKLRRTMFKDLKKNLEKKAA